MTHKSLTKRIIPLVSLALVAHLGISDAGADQQQNFEARNILLHESVPQIVAPNGRIAAKVHRHSTVTRSWILRIYKFSDDDFRPKQIYDGWPVHSAKLILRTKRSFLPFVSWAERELLVLGTVNSRIDDENDLRVVSWSADSCRLLVEVKSSGATALEEVDVRTGGRKILLTSQTYTRLLLGDDDRYSARPRHYFQATGYSRDGTAAISEFVRAVGADNAHSVGRYTVVPPGAFEPPPSSMEDSPAIQFRRRLRPLLDQP